ncbi:hypothetical protein OG604_02105 [Streptomyces sp. NBC_01231]|nr:hypothetical protein OG604_02105 [Streptomyces sp. NBC_01231]
MQAGAGLEDVGDDQPDQHGRQGQHQEVADRLHTDPADLAQVVHRGDAGGDHAEDDRDHDHLDQCDEPVVERLQILTQPGREDADGDAEDGGQYDLEPQLTYETAQP